MSILPDQRPMEFAQKNPVCDIEEKTRTREVLILQITINISDRVHYHVSVKNHNTQWDFDFL